MFQDWQFLSICAALLLMNFSLMYALKVMDRKIDALRSEIFRLRASVMLSDLMKKSQYERVGRPSCLIPTKQSASIVNGPFPSRRHSIRSKFSVKGATQYPLTRKSLKHTDTEPGENRNRSK